MSEYQEFLKNKAQDNDMAGFDPVFMPDFLFGFQKYLVDWVVRKGRGAIFADCGLGKTPMQLVVGQNVVEHTNRPMLILTPLAVTAQTVREAEKFGMQCRYSRDGKVGPGLNVTNYERIHLFDPNDFAGTICDESSILKSFDGKRRKEITDFMKKHQFRFLFTATAAPNDYIELGTSSEALGYLGQMDMLSTFFRSLDDVNHIFNKAGDFWNTHKWVFKAHSEQMFWRWVTSWARAIKKPSDYGFPDEGFELPPLTVDQTVVENQSAWEGFLFPQVAVSLAEQRLERKATINERCQKVAELVAHDRPAVVWCHMNEEGDLLESLIPGAKQVAGKHTDDEKEQRFLDFASGDLRVIITKPKIGAFGLNWQHCNHATFFPSHSFEQYYQAVRRIWRFGQERPVTVDIVTTEGEAGVTDNLKRKAGDAEKMFASLVAEMTNSLGIKNSYTFDLPVEAPSWL